jgi:ankyrin repeat protein
MQEINQRIFKAAEAGHINEVKGLLTQKISINVKNTYNESLLITATVGKHHDLVRSLLDHENLDLHIQGYLTGTALTFAIFSDQDDIAKTLLAKEERFNNVEHPGAINWAVLNKNEALLELLKAKGANFDLPGLTGLKDSPEWVGKPEPDPRNTPFHHEYLSVLKHTPLCLAILNKKPELVEFLIDKCGVNPNVVNENGDLPLQIAAEQNNEKIVRLLLSKGADPSLLQDSKSKEDEKIPAYLKIRKPKINATIMEILAKSKGEKLSQSSSVPMLFWSNNTLAAASEDKTLDEKLIAYLKANIELWKHLTNTPGSWDAIQHKIKQEILKDSPRSNSSIPVS